MPREDLLRIAAAFQAVIGFALLTGAITWVLSIYPALARQRTTGAVVAASVEARGTGERPRDPIPPVLSAGELRELTKAIAAYHVDLNQYPSTFYFAPLDRATSLATRLPWLVAAAATLRSEGGETGLAAAELSITLQRLLATIAQDHLGLSDATSDEVMRAYARH